RRWTRTAWAASACLTAGGGPNSPPRRGRAGARPPAPAPRTRCGGGSASPTGSGAQALPARPRSWPCRGAAPWVGPGPVVPVWEVGSRDALIAPRPAEEALAALRRAYKALGAEGQLAVDRFEGGHEWSGRLAYPLLEKVLG